MIIEQGSIHHLDELESLYDGLNDYLSATVNYPGWIKDVYPVRETARQGIEEESLFVARENGVIAGSVILNHEPEEAYELASWLVEADYKDILVIRTLVVHPLFLKRQVGTSLMKFAEEYAVGRQMRSIRLDVSVNNVPGISLYKKLGYRYVGTVDLGLPYEHLKWFQLYELVL